MNNYLNKRVEIREKLFSQSSTIINKKFNTIVGIVTNIYDNKFIELDNKILIALEYIYTIEVIG